MKKIFIGLLCLSGIICAAEPCDNEDYHQRLQKRIDRGDITAYSRMGLHYSVGHKDHKTAIEYYAEGVRQGDVEALHRLGRALIYDETPYKNEKDGMECLKAASDSGYCKATLTLADIHRLKQDLATAKQLYEKVSNMKCHPRCSGYKYPGRTCSKKARKALEEDFD